MSTLIERTLATNIADTLSNIEELDFVFVLITSRTIGALRLSDRIRSIFM